MEYVTLNNGVKMPIVGLGTWNIHPENLSEIVDVAYHNGYTRFDTAWKYRNEQKLGEIFKQLNIPRERLFIETKLHENQSYLPKKFRKLPIRIKSIRRAFDSQCKDLQTDYIDLYLLHWPFYNFIEMWEEIEKLYNEGRIRAIGVSGFTKIHLDELKRVSNIVPALNQIEISPYNTNVDIAADSIKKGIHVEAYTMFNGKPEASPVLMNDQRLLEIAKRHDKSVANIICRWAIQHGYSIVPRTNNIEHLIDNINVFDYTLSEIEMKDIDSLDRKNSIWGDPRKDINYKR